MQPLQIKQSVGEGCTNNPDDVKAVKQRMVLIGIMPCGVEIDIRGVYASFLNDLRMKMNIIDEETLKCIKKVQRHFMIKPDGKILVGGQTHKFLNTWKKKSINKGVDLSVGRLQEAWNWVSPLLPEGSFCNSGYRSEEKQRQLLHDFYKITYKENIISKYGQNEYDRVNKDILANEQDVLKMVRGVGQKIAAPGKSPHQKGKAIDIGGPYDKKQSEIVKLVAAAHPDLFNGTVLIERNGCVHFEIK